MLRRVSTILTVALAVTAASTVFAQGPGADTYKAKCQMCHGADGKGKMPAFKGKLTDDQIKQVVAYVRTLAK